MGVINSINTKAILSFLRYQNSKSFSVIKEEVVRKIKRNSQARLSTIHVQIWKSFFSSYFLKRCSEIKVADLINSSHKYSLLEQRPTQKLLVQLHNRTTINLAFRLVLTVATLLEKGQAFRQKNNGTIP